MTATATTAPAGAQPLSHMALTGPGVGMLLQNLVLAVQNVVAPADLGTASSLVAFTRTLGGAIGVSALGALLSHQVTSHLVSGLRSAGIDPARAGAVGSSGGVPDLAKIPQPVRGLVQAAFGSAIADVFLTAAPFAVIALVLVLFFKETALRSSAGDHATGDQATSAQVPAGAEQPGQQVQPEQRAASGEAGGHHGRHAVPVDATALASSRRPTDGRPHVARHVDRRVPVDAVRDHHPERSSSARDRVRA